MTENLDLASASTAGYTDLAQRALLFLEKHDGHASEEALINSVFGVRGKVEIWGGILARVLNDPAKFHRLTNGEWALANQVAGSTGLGGLEFVVLDCETTGLHPQSNRIIEIACIRLRGGQRIETFQTFLNPHRRIPHYITSLTGITNEQTSRAPGFGQINDKLAEFLGSAIVVGHNVLFDMRFINAERQRLQRPPLLNETLDTISLALKLFPGLRRPNLDRLAMMLGLPVANRHRAFGDASLTADALLKLLNMAEEQGFTTLQDLRSGRSRSYNKLKLEAAEPAAEKPSALDIEVPDDNLRPDRIGSTRRVRNGFYDNTKLVNRATAHARDVLSRELIRDLPNAPGVYLMRDANEKIIYIGKAKNLRDRVSSYYSEPLGYTRKMDGLAEAIARIDHIVCGSELEALLLESKLIKKHLPRYNRQLRNYDSYPFIKINLQHRFPRVQVTYQVADDGARYFGPFNSSRAVHTTVEIIQQLFALRTCDQDFDGDKPARKRKPYETCLRLNVGKCLGPCVGNHDEASHARYSETVNEVINFLSGEKEEMLDVIWKRLQDASARQDFERAKELRDALEQVERTVRSQHFLSAAVERNNLLICLPSSQAHSAEVLCVYRGKLGRQVRVNLEDAPPKIADELATVWEGLGRQEAALAATHADWDKKGGRVIGQEAVDEINIIARWVYTHADDPAIIRVPLGPTDHAFWLTTSQTILTTDNPDKLEQVHF